MPAFLNLLAMWFLMVQGEIPIPSSKKWNEKLSYTTLAMFAVAAFALLVIPGCILSQEVRHRGAGPASRPFWE